jgi:hypothetical protein
MAEHLRPYAHLAAHSRWGVHPINLPFGSSSGKCGGSLALELCSRSLLVISPCLVQTARKSVAANDDR